jgi:hypothetical protein
LSTLAAILLICHSAQGAENASACRLRIEKIPDSPWPTSVGVVEFWPSITCGGTFNVSTAEGKPVHFQTVWVAVVQPTLIRFDTSSGATSYDINFETNAAAPPGAWTPQGGVLLETRGGRPQPVDTLEQVTRLLANAEAQGRSFVPQVFQGVNPHGPSADYVALFDGWFNVSRDGTYEFATISSGASSLQVDGRKIADWLGRHDPHGGRRGERSGRIALKTGAHRLEISESKPSAFNNTKRPRTERISLTIFALNFAYASHCLPAVLSWWRKPLNAHSGWASRSQIPARLFGLRPGVDPLLHFAQVRCQIKPPGLETHVIGAAHGGAQPDGIGVV